MKILTWNVLCSLAPASKWGLDIAVTMKAVRHFYCMPMQARGLCTEVCENCKLSLTAGFNIAGARKPIGLLVWNLKNEMAKNQEKNVHVATEERDAWGRLSTPEDPFAELGRQFETSSKTR